MANREIARLVAACILITAVLLILLVMVPKGQAIPAFSRKYQTSCTTCHNNYPELNDFGLAFKKNGFKFPKDDETFVKEAPVLLYYHGANEYNHGNSVFTNLNLGTINEPFYRVGGDIHFRYRSKFELYGVGLVGHDNNHLVDTGAGTITNAKAVTFTGGFVTANYWIFPWLISTMRYDFVNSPSDFFNGTPASQYLSPTKRWSRLPMGCWHLRVPRSGAGNEGPFSSKTYWWSCIPDCAGASVFQLATRCRAIAKSRCQPQRGRLGDSCWNSFAGKAKPGPIFQEN